MAVRSFDDFSPANDPFGEHDFGKIIVRDQTVYWKLDCYDPDLAAGSEDPADEARTCHVLTILLAEEY